MSDSYLEYTLRDLRDSGLLAGVQTIPGGEVTAWFGTPNAKTTETKFKGSPGEAATWLIHTAFDLYPGNAFTQKRNPEVYAVWKAAEDAKVKAAAVKLTSAEMAMADARKAP